MKSSIKYIILIGITLIIGILIGKYAFSNNTGQTKTATGQHAGETAVEHWTCSMHPQIDMPEPGQCPICGMDLIPKTEDKQDNASENAIKMTKTAMALANIETMQVGTSTNSNQAVLTLPGKIAVNTDRSAMQTAHFGGRIEKLYFQSEGDFVRAGSLIALVYSPELVTAQNELLEAYYIKNEQPELYNSVRNKLKNWKISEKQISRIEHTKKVITNFPMYADHKGYITKVLVQEGNHIKEGTPIFELADLQKVWAVFDVYEKDLSALKTGQKIKIRINAYPSKEIKGKVSYIDPLVNETTGTVQVRVVLDNRKKLLKPGMLLEGILQEKAGKQTGIMLPKTAVMWTGKRSIVYVKTNPEQPVFELREVQIGKEYKNDYEILSGLQQGEEVVVNGTFTVDATAQLQGKKSMMNRKTENKKPVMQHDKKSTKEKPDKKQPAMKCASGKCGDGM